MNERIYQDDRRQLCIELPLIKDRLMRAGLLRTAHKMDEACKEIGYECAEQFESEGRGERARLVK